MDELSPEERGNPNLSFFQRHRTKLLTGSIATLAVIASAFAAQKAIHTASEVEGTVKKVKVIERNSSNCLPRIGETTPRRPALCKAGFDKAVQLISPYQACQISAKGAPLMLVNGERVKTIECIQPPPKTHGSSGPQASTRTPQGPTHRPSQPVKQVVKPNPQGGSSPGKKHQSKPPQGNTPSTPPAETVVTPPTDNGQGKNKGNHGDGTGTEAPKGNGPDGGGPPGQSASLLEDVTDATGQAVGKVFGQTCTLLDEIAQLCDPS